MFVTHSIYEAAFLSTRVIVMAANPGRIFAEHVIDEPLPRGEGFRIIPGMPVTADVKIGERTVLSYLLGRVVPVAKEGMREP